MGNKKNTSLSPAVSSFFFWCSMSSDEFSLSFRLFPPPFFFRWGQDYNKIIGFDLSENSLSSSVPTELGLFADLESVFDLSSNELVGSLPEVVFRGLTKFREHLNLGGGNRLTGSLPTEIGTLSSLTSSFGVADTFLNGSLPTELGFWTAFTSTFAGEGTILDGSLPSQLGLWPMTSNFSVYRSSLLGRLPTELGQWSMAANFEINSNQLTGTLPTELGEWTALTTKFRLYKNSFLGAIPSEAGR